MKFSARRAGAGRLRLGIDLEPMPGIDRTKQDGRLL